MTTNQDYNIFVGTETGILKGVDSERGLWNNATTMCKADRQKEIVCLCWNDNFQNELCIGRRDQTVSVFNAKSNAVVKEMNFSAGEGTFKGLSKIGSDYITCTESGCVRLWSSAADCKLELDVGKDICCMRTNPAQQTLIATGGKENDLKIWNLEDTTRPLFTAKNVANDWLNLRVPIWVTDVSFIPNTKQIVTSTNYHQVRLYDPAAGVRRPQMEVVYDECPIKSLSLRPNSSCQFIVGNSHGGMALIDLRGKGSVVQHYKGAEGGIRAVACHPTEDIVLSCGLDRYLRVHDINTRHLIQKLYLKSRLNCILISNKTIPSTASDNSVENPAEMSISEECEPVEHEHDDAIWSTMVKIKTKEGSENLETKSSAIKNSRRRRASPHVAERCSETKRKPQHSTQVKLKPPGRSRKTLPLLGYDLAATERGDNMKSTSKTKKAKTKKLK